jgi:hypothetical protein
MSIPVVKSSGAALVAVLLLSGSGIAAAAGIAADAKTLGATADLTARLPASRNFTVAAAGQVRVTLTDLAAPQAFTQLKLVVSRGGTRVASLASAGSQDFAATAGDYKVQVVGMPAAASSSSGPAGTFQVTVRELAGNTELGNFTDGVAALPAAPTAQSGLDTSVPLPVGTYEVTLSDRGFPAALSSVDLLLDPASASGGTVAISGPCITACTQNLTVTTAGNYDLFVVATAANPDQAGLYSLKISRTTGGAVAYATTQPVGRLAAATGITLAAGTHTLSAADFATPVALSSLRFRLAQGADMLASLDAPGSSAAFSAAAGAAQLFTFARAGSGGLGVYGVGVTQGIQSVYRDVRTLPAGHDETLGAGGYGYTFTVPAAANYRLRLRDLNFPTALGQLRAVVVQNGSAVQAVSGTNVDTSFMLAAGPALLAVIGSPATISASSLMGISLAPQAGGTALLDQAQGIGALYFAQPVDVPAAGSYDLAVTDLQFPAAFSELTAVVTRGSELVGQVFGSNVLRFNAQQGAHSINLLARPDATAKYGTWGFQLAATPPPTVTLAATPSSIEANDTTSLTWSATGASSCTASGGWSGPRALSGTETSAALGSATTFTLSCTGDGGSASSSATVTIKSSGDGGGGGVGVGSLLLLAAMLCVRRRLHA